MSYVSYPINGVPIYATAADFPATAQQGALAVAADSGDLYEFFNGTWDVIATPTGGSVTSVNGETGSITIAAGPGISVVNTPGTITINNTESGNAYYVNEFTLSNTDITNKYVTLSQAPDVAASTILTVIGGPMQSYGADFTVSGSQLSWSGLFLDGVLTSGDMLVIQFN